MKKQLMIVGIIILLITVGLCGCNEQDVPKYSIVGTWIVREVDTQFIFRDDGTGTINGIESIENFTYSINATIIYISFKEMPNFPLGFKYRFLSEDVLSLAYSISDVQELILDRT